MKKAVRQKPIRKCVLWRYQFGVAVTKLKHLKGFEKKSMKTFEGLWEENNFHKFESLYEKEIIWKHLTATVSFRRGSNFQTFEEM